MNLIDIANALYRRWWIVVAVLVLTAVGVVLTVANAESEYEATATLLLASPELSQSSGELEESTPATLLRPAIILEIVEGDGTRAEVVPDGLSADYSVTQTADGILRVEASGESEAAVVETANAVVDEIHQVVAELDDMDDFRSASVEILARPRFARERTLVDTEGEEAVEYLATGSVLLTINESIVTDSGNPYSASGGTLRVLREVASADVAQEAIARAVGDEDATFELLADSQDVAPIMYVVARASHPQLALDTLDATLAFLDADLAERQALAGASESMFIWYQRLSYPNQAQEISGSLRRPIATVVVLGVVAATSLAILVDNVVKFRKREWPLPVETSGKSTGRRKDRAL